MPIKIKDHGKCKEWERRRRDRLNDAFKNLAQLLPHYDPAKIPAKIDILEKSTEFVKELRLSNSRLLSNQAENDEKCKLIKELQDEVNKLILRVKQLTILLKTANITIPTGPQLKSLGNKKLKWSGKLKPVVDAENSSTTGLKLSSVQTETILKKTSLPENEDVPEVSTTPATPGPDKEKSTEHETNTGSTTSNNPPATNNNSGSTIVIPLKETNSIKSIPKSTASALVSSCTTTSSNSVSITTVPSLSLLNANLPSGLSSVSPIKMISADPIFTTTTAPIQLPLQTFILTPCPITGGGATTALPVGAQHSQILTRIALPTPFLQKPVDSIRYQKIPIKPVLKPVPRIIKRRKRRSKKADEASLEKGVSEPKKDKVNVNGQDKNVQRSCLNQTTEETLETVPPCIDISETQTATSASSEKPENNESSHNIIAEKDKEITNETSQIEREVNDSNPKCSENEAVTMEDVDIREPEVLVPTSVDPVVSAPPPDCEIPVLRIIEERVGESQAGLQTDVLCNVSVIIQPDKNVEKVSASENGRTNAKNITSKNTDKNAELLPTTPSPPENVLQTISIDSRIDEDATALMSGESSNTMSKKIVTISNAPPPSAPSSNAGETGREDVVETVLPITPIEQESLIEKADINKSDHVNTMTRDGNATAVTAISKPSTQIEQSSYSGDVERIHQTANKENSSSITKETGKLQLSDHINLVPSISSNVTEVVESSSLLANSGDVERPETTEEPEASFRELQINNDRESATPASVEPVIFLPSSVVPEKVKELPSTPSNSSKPNEQTTKDLPNPLIETTKEMSVTTTDKISECIARSIDLIDANDSELMELSEHWEDPCGSPKTPISPTQMFLNMFPLLPRESSNIDHHHSHHGSHIPSSSSQLLPMTPSSSHKNSTHFPSSTSNRSSFFIDAMLPDDHSVPGSSNSLVEEMGIVSSTHVTPCLALTPPQFSSNQQVNSPFSMSTNFYWTPTATPSTFDASFDFRPGSSLTPHGNSAIAPVTSSDISATFSTFSPVTLTMSKESSTAPRPVTAASVTITAVPSTNKSTISTTKSGRNIKTLGTSKHSSSSNPSPAIKSKKTNSSTTTSSATSVTWTISAPTHTSTSHTHSQQALPVPGNQSTANIASGSQLFSYSGATTPSTCSLLDSLNPMDASFFRPLLNALDSHDFRSLDFTSGNPLPPPPPLPKLIPSKSLYSAQFNSSSTSFSPQPLGISYTTEDHNMQTLSVPLIHNEKQSQHPSIYSSAEQHQESSPSMSTIVNTNVMQHPPTATSTGSPKKSQHNTNREAQSSMDNNSISLETLAKSQVASADKPPKGRSSRQKLETSKQSRSGKSSRTQPYYVPSTGNTPTGSGKNIEKPVHPIVSQIHTHSSVKHTNSSGENTINRQNDPKPTLSSKPATVSPSKSFPYPSQPGASKFSENFPIFQNQQYSKHQISVDNGQQLSHQSQPQHLQHHRQTSKKSSSEGTKAQKKKEEKANSASRPTKPNNNNNEDKYQSNQPVVSAAADIAVPSSSSTSSMQSSNHSALSLSQQPVRIHHPQIMQKQTQEVSTRSYTHSEDLNNMVHSNQYLMEPFVGHPDFNSENNSRQFSTYGTNQSHNQTPNNMMDQRHSQQHSHTSTDHRSHSHPYYLPEVPPFENFVPVQQHPQPMFQPIQQNIAAQTGSNHNSNHPKFTNYVPNRQNINTQQPVPSSSDITESSERPRTIHQQSQNAPTVHNQHLHPVRQQGNQQYSQQHPLRVHMQVHGPSVVQQPSQHQSQHQSQDTTTQLQPLSNRRTAASVSTSTSSIASATKSKSSQQTASAMSYDGHQQQQQQSTTTHHNLHQQQHQQPTRSSSRTVNWMTDTGYRTANSSNTKQQNPFSVSKLVGTSGNQSKSQQLHTINVEPSQQVSQQCHARPGNNQREKPGDSSISSNNTSGHLSSSNSNSNSICPNQSSYCAEALIRKAPQPSGGEWNEYNFGANPPFQSYPTHPAHHHIQSNPTNPHTENNEQFPNYSQYAYPPNSNAGSSSSSSVTSHFAPFEYSHSQEFHPSQHSHASHTSNQNQQINYQSTSTQPPPNHTHQQNLSHPHSSNQFHYHQGHQHHQNHGSSSVSNFNLSTIFPEINDKRSRPNNPGPSNNSSGSHVQSGGNNCTSSGTRSGGNMSSSCSYPHAGFGNQTGSGRN